MAPVKHLILHLGLPKTGTTFLQREIFPRWKKTLGYMDRQELAGIARLRQITQWYPPSIWGTAKERSATLNLRNAIAASPEQEIRFISFENILATNLFAPNQGAYFNPVTGERWSPVSHLPFILDLFAPNRLKTTILLTLRHQPEWIASLYAQSSNRIPWASQWHFEAQVRRELGLLRVGLPSFLDYAALAEELTELVPRVEVGAFDLETMGIDVLKDFLEARLGVCLDALPKTLGSPANVRQNRPGRWKLRRLDFAPPNNPRNLNRNGLTSLFTSFKPATSITLRESLREEIVLACKSHNERLQHLKLALAPVAWD